jgi:hypothetical protein
MPRTRGTPMRRPFRAGWGSVVNDQFSAAMRCALTTPAGMSTAGWRPAPPAPTMT